MSCDEMFQVARAALVRSVENGRRDLLPAVHLCGVSAHDTQRHDTKHTRHAPQQGQRKAAAGKPKQKRETLRKRKNEDRRRSVLRVRVRVACVR